MTGASPGGSDDDRDGRLALDPEHLDANGYLARPYLPTDRPQPARERSLVLRRHAAAAVVPALDPLAREPGRGHQHLPEARMIDHQFAHDRERDRDGRDDQYHVPVDGRAGRQPEGEQILDQPHGHADHQELDKADEPLTPGKSRAVLLGQGNVRRLPRYHPVPGTGNRPGGAGRAGQPAIW